MIKLMGTGETGPNGQAAQTPAGRGREPDQETVMTQPQRLVDKAAKIQTPRWKIVTHENENQPRLKLLKTLSPYATKPMKVQVKN